MKRAEISARAIGPSGPRQAGFSLIEVFVTVAILAAVTLSSILVAVPVSRQTRLSREMELANAEVRRVVERIESMPFSTITSSYPQYSEYTIAGLKDGKIAVSYADPAADPLQVQVTLTWTSPDLGSMTRTFTTARTQ